MRRFAEAYPDFQIGQAVPDQLTWSHHIILISYVSEAAARHWYAQETIKNGWGYRHLMMEIKNDLYGRKGKKSLKTSNYLDVLTEPHSTLANEALKDPYKFHFLTVGEDAHEREVERGLVAHITQFMLERVYATYSAYQ
jgi:predicted nuclease of restriction endonuclease-like (RecB) superfamily